MSIAMHNVIDRLLDRRDLTANDMQAAVSEVMAGEVDAILLSAFLTALKLKGESVSEIVGAARAMRERAVRIRPDRARLLDTCGTGGDELCTFNISTSAAIVAAACGIAVAKHGNRSVSSSSGSADVLEALGVRIDLAPDEVGRCIDEVGIGFCFAPLVHGAMKHAAAVRRQLGFRTIFNLLGPLTNPAGATHQLVGANNPATAEKLARALAELNQGCALVVCGAGELDEVSLWGETAVWEVIDGGVSGSTWTADTFGLPECRVEQLQVDSPQQSARVIEAVLSGERGPARDMILANAAAASLAARQSHDPREAIERAAAAVDSGRAAEVCRQLVEWTNR